MAITLYATALGLAISALLGFSLVFFLIGAWRFDFD